MNSSVREFKDSTILVASLYSGLPDPECQIRFEKSWTLPCRQQKSVKEEGPNGFPGRWLTLLKLPTLSESNEHRLKALIARIKSSSQDSIRQEEEPKRIRVNFTNYQQMIDGGVLEHTPIKTALQGARLMPLSGLDPSDTIFVLQTSDLAKKTTNNREFIGGWDILSNALDQLWESYQRQAIEGAVMGDLNDASIHHAQQWIINVLDWRRELEEKLGKDRLVEIESKMSEKFPAEDPVVYFASPQLFQLRSLPKVFLLEPRLNLFQGTFDVNKKAIREALYHGCAVAAAELRINVEDLEYPRNLFLQKSVQREPECDRLLE